MSLDDQIDQLYRLPLSEFTAARDALAKSLGATDRDAAKRVRGLAKPTVVPWAVNQLFWRARAVFDRLLRSGQALRRRQIAALSGRPPKAGKTASVSDLSHSHRTALAEAVGEARRVAAAHGVTPDADELSRMLEALSLAAAPPDHPGRLTEVVRPAGFEALNVGSSSLADVGSGFSRIAKQTAPTAPAEAGAHKLAREHARRAEEARQARARAEEKRRLEAAAKAAEQNLARTKEKEARAREALEHATTASDEAQARLGEARKRLRVF